MPPARKLCLDCSRPSRSPRCPTCTARRRATNYGSAEYRTISAALLAAHRRQYGPWCPECEDTTDDLTVDHIRPIAYGGSHKPSNLRVVCRSCNSRKGDARIKRAR